MDTLLIALLELKLSAMAQALETQRELPGSYGELGLEERLSLMVEAEKLHRENKRICRLRRQYKYACRKNRKISTISRGEE